MTSCTVNRSPYNRRGDNAPQDHRSCGAFGLYVLGTACFITVRAIISHAAAGKRFLRPEFLTPFYFLFVIGLSAWVGKLQGRSVF